MDLSDLLKVIAIATIVGFALYLPFSQWFKWRRDSGLRTAHGRYGRPLHRRFIVWSVVPVVIMVIGFNMRYLAPDTWIAQLTQSREGRDLFFIMTICFVGAAYLGWVLFRLLRRRGRRQ